MLYARLSRDTIWFTIEYETDGYMVKSTIARLAPRLPEVVRPRKR